MIHIEAQQFPSIWRYLQVGLLAAEEVDVGEWHSQQLPRVEQFITRELRNVSFTVQIPNELEALQNLLDPNLPWAENHFKERVCGEPLNPPPSAAEWPYADKGHEKHVDEEGQFSHTYPERLWPKNANRRQPPRNAKYKRMVQERMGIRFAYGDLMDVVNLLHKSPSTRQAYLPIWFPEDTGAVHGERVPCSLGYHFLIRNNQLHVTYMIRSCDFVRHFRDDVYMAARLCQWVRDQIVDREGPDDLPVPQGLQVGDLTMHTMSMHIFNGDVKNLEKQQAMS